MAMPVDTSVIETVEAIRERDKQDMLGRIKDLPKQVRDAWSIARTAALSPQLADVRNIVVAGMGGSAIGGDLAAALLQGELRVPMAVHRDYGLPAYVGRDTLVIASSYSGNTEETLTGLAEAKRRGAKVLCLTTGGQVASFGQANGYPVVTFSYEARPRAALGYSLGLVLGVLGRLGFVRDLSADVEAALADVARLEERVHEGARTNDAKQLAIALAGRIPYAFGAGVMGVMARRLKGQLNENSKSWAAFDVLPELNHNAVVGFAEPRIAREALVVVLLRSEHDNPRTQIRWDVTKELLDRAEVQHHTLRFPGSSLLSEVLQMTYFTDYVSFYVALLNGADPSPHDPIDYLKDRLAKA
jgi:glucose/mannose-6-phosphate isomerase